MSDIPQEIGAAYDETTQSLTLSQVASTSNRGTRSFIDPNRIWRSVIDEDAGVIRVTAVG